MLKFEWEQVPSHLTMTIHQAMARAAAALLLAVTLRGASGAVTVADDAAPHGKRGHRTIAVSAHGDVEPHGAPSAHRGEDVVLHSTADPAQAVEKGAKKGPEAEEDAEESSPDQAEPEKAAEELQAEGAEPEEAAEEDAEELDAEELDAEEDLLPQRSRRHDFAGGGAAEEEQGGGVIMRRHNHTKGADLDDGDLEEEESLVQEDADLEEQGGGVIMRRHNHTKG